MARPLDLKVGRPEGVPQSGMAMTSRERVLKTLRHEVPDRVPLFTFSIDPKFIVELGGGSPARTFAALGLDTFPLRAQNWCQGVPLLASLRMDIPPEMQTAGGAFGGWHGVDEFGRLWERGSYVGGVLRDDEDLARYVPPLRLEERTPPEMVRHLRAEYADKAFSLDFHCGPFGLTMESLGLPYFAEKWMGDRAFVLRVLDARTDWFIAVARHVVELGADFVVMGDDVAFKGSTFISPRQFREHVIPRYRRIVESLAVPVVWHSDGYVTPLLAGAIEAGIAGIQPLEPLAGVDLAEVKHLYGDELVLIGNVDCAHVLCQPDLELVRQEVRRCLAQAKAGGGYMLSDSNSLHAGCRTDAVVEMFRYAAEVGVY